MNTQAKYELPGQYVPCELSRKILKGMASALDPDGLRLYSRCIGIKNGKACVTNGFAAAWWESESFKGYECQLDSDIFPIAGIKFPDWEHCIPKVGTALENAKAIVDLMACYKTPKKDIRYPRKPFLAVRGGKVTLEMGIQKDADACFDPTVLAKFLKTVPVDLLPSSALLCGDKELLQISFGEQADFKVLIVAVKMPED